MKKFLFSLLALLAVTVSITQAQQVRQRHIAHLGFANSSNGGIEFFAYCDVVFTPSGDQMIPTRIHYSTGVHAMLMTGTELRTCSRFVTEVI